MNKQFFSPENGNFRSQQMWWVVCVTANQKNHCMDVLVEGYLFEW